MQLLYRLATVYRLLKRTSVRTSSCRAWISATSAWSDAINGATPLRLREAEGAGLIMRSRWPPLPRRVGERRKDGVHRGPAGRGGVGVRGHGLDAVDDPGSYRGGRLDAGSAQRVRQTVGGEPDRGCQPGRALSRVPALPDPGHPKDGAARLSLQWARMLRRGAWKKG